MDGTPIRLCADLFRAHEAHEWFLGGALRRQCPGVIEEDGLFRRRVMESEWEAAACERSVVGQPQPAEVRAARPERADVPGVCAPSPHGQVAGAPADDAPLTGDEGGAW